MVAMCKFLLLNTIVVVISFSAVVHADGNNIDNSDVHLKTTQLLNKYGYQTETHHVVTEDGYILEMHRIVGVLKNGNYRSSWRKTVLLQHGLAGSSANWVIVGPQRSLAYLLADRGYDVWLGNNRGNIYSRNHTTLSPDDREFWNFSWNEMGIYDLPAMIDYIISQTKLRKIFYIAHSQGTTQFWVMASERPTYNEKIILMTAFAPAAYTGNLQGPITKLAKLTHFGVWLGENFGYPEFTPRSSWSILISDYLCNNKSVTQFICPSAIFLISGYSPEELDPTSLAVIIGHVPAGASWKQVLHFGQGSMEQGRFRKYDYNNDEKNFRLYNSTLPPEYPLKNIRVPVAFFSSENDWLASPKDVGLLASKIDNLIFNYKVPMDSFSHNDFLWGIHAPELVYTRLFNLLEEYDNT